jgi:hypothetical protein
MKREDGENVSIHPNLRLRMLLYHSPGLVTVTEVAGYDRNLDAWWGWIFRHIELGEKDNELHPENCTILK